MSNMVNFIITLLFGWCGAHKFLQKKVGMGFLYLCTFGLFGIGWGIDCIRALLLLLHRSPESHAASISQNDLVEQLCTSLDPEFVSFVLPMVKSGISFGRIEQAYCSSHPDSECTDISLRIQYVSNYYTNATTLADLSSCGSSKYRIVSCDDSKLCDICKRFKGRSFPVSSAKIGYNCPPFHLGCRCLIVIEEE